MCLHRSLAVALVTAVVLAGSGQAQSSLTANTLALDDSTHRPPASLEDVRWFVGSWVGEGLGGTTQEVWAPPEGNTMVGLFKLTHNGSPSMYEIMWFVEEHGTIALKLKHFNADFSAWEDKTEMVTFPLVALEETAVHLRGLTFRRLGPDRMEIFIALWQDGVVREEKLVYWRHGESDR